MEMNTDLDSADSMLTDSTLSAARRFMCIEMNGPIYTIAIALIGRSEKRFTTEPDAKIGHFHWNRRRRRSFIAAYLECRISDGFGVDDMCKCIACHVVSGFQVAYVLSSLVISVAVKHARPRGGRELELQHAICSCTGVMPMVQHQCGHVHKPAQTCLCCF